MARGPRHGQEGPGWDCRGSAPPVETAKETARADREFVREAEERLSVGIRYPLTRTPHSYVLMLKMSLRDFKATYGEHRAIAALAVIVEDESVGKKRMIHDATHRVRVNHRIRCRDKIRAPGAREKMEARQVAFSVVGDIARRLLC